MTLDISNEVDLEYEIQFIGVRYDYEALERLEMYRDKIYSLLSNTHIIPPDNSILFESAERTYKQELKRLAAKIHRLLVIRNNEIKAIKSELNTIDRECINKIEPGHPDDVLPSGQLSKRGIDCCYTLFAKGVSNLVVSYLMRISHASISKRRTRWELARRQENSANNKIVE